MQIESNIYDTEEWVYGANVQILSNSITGEVSVGWKYPTLNTQIDLIRTLDIEEMAETIYELNDKSYEEIVNTLNILDFVAEEVKSNRDYLKRKLEEEPYCYSSVTEGKIGAYNSMYQFLINLKNAIIEKREE